MPAASPILTVIVPSFQMEDFLPRCLESLVPDDQALRPALEVIVVNDGSTDRTGAIAHGFAHRYPELFRVIDKPNGNYGSCVNAALPQSRGRYVRLVDADDCIDRAGHAALLRALADEDAKGTDAADAVVTDYLQVEPHRATRISFPGNPERTAPARWICGVYRVSVHALTYRTDLVRTMGYRQTEGFSYTDTEWIIEPMSRVRRLRYLPTVVTHYTLGRRGQTVEAATVAAHFGQMVTVVKGLVTRYDRIRAAAVPEAVPYYDGQVAYMLRMVYFACLFGWEGRRVCADLAAFDRFLREVSPGLYGRTDDLSFRLRLLGEIRFVRAWRRHSPGLRLLQAAYRIMHWIERVRNG